MTTKEYTLEMLHILKSVWLPAYGWIYTIEQGYAGADIIQTLRELLQRAAKLTTDERLQEKLKKSVSFLDLLEEKEEISKKQDEDDLSALDEMLSELGE